MLSNKISGFFAVFFWLLSNNAIAFNTTDAPLWIDDPRLVNYIGVSGYSDVTQWGEQQQLNAALINAQNKLSLKIRQHQDLLSVLINKMPGEVYSAELDDSIQQLVLENAIVHEEWKHPETGRLYLWLVIPVTR